MKIKKIVLLVLLFVGFSLFSQKKNNDKRSQIKAIKVAYITTELNLTADEAAKFWPVFNGFEDKQREIRKENIKLFRGKLQDESLNAMSEKEAGAILAQMENTEIELQDLKKKYVSNLKEILPAIKILKLKKAEDSFSRKLLQQYKSKK